MGRRGGCYSILMTTSVDPRRAGSLGTSSRTCMRVRTCTCTRAPCMVNCDMSVDVAIVTRLTLRMHAQLQLRMRMHFQDLEFIGSYACCCRVPPAGCVHMC